MRLLVSTIFVGALLCLAPTASWADLAPYSQDFEGLGTSAEDPFALGNDGWLGFANVFTPGGGYLYGYGPFPAPNGGPGFCGIDVGQGGPAQGDKQLVTYSDYNNGDHANGNLIEANVFQEQTVSAADVGSTWLFEYDAKRGNIDGSTMALAFFKTLDPNAGYMLTNFITVDMTGVPTTWDTYSLSIFIDPSLEGQILQFGFLNLATNYEGSGIFYDNVNFGLAPLSVSLDITPGGFPNALNPRRNGVIPVAILGAADFDVAAVDVTTVAFGPGGAAPVHNGHLEDVNFDGLMDLVAHFLLRDTGIACGDTEASISGALLDGTLFEGTDSIETVGCQAPTPIQQVQSVGTTPSAESSVFGK